MKFRPWWLIGLAALSGIIVIEDWNFNGLCYRDRRYLSNQEFIDKAIEQSINDNRRSEENIHYKSIDEFLQQNTSCCVLFKDGHSILPEGTWVRFFGWYVAVVEVWYKIKNTGPDNYHLAYFSLDACGKVLQRHVFTESAARR